MGEPEPGREHMAERTKYKEGAQVRNFEDMRKLASEALKGADADYCEFRFEDSRETVIQFQGAALENVKKANLYGGNVRALHNGGWGFASFNSIDELDRNVKLACSQARAAGKAVGGKSRLAEAPVVVDDYRPEFGMHPESVSLSEKLEVLGKYHKLALSYDNIPSANIQYQERATTLFFANTEGSAIRQEKLDFAMSVSAQARKGDVSVAQAVGEGSSLGIDKLYGLEGRIREMCERAQQLLDAPSIKAGVYTVVCDPTHAGLFVHEAFGHLSEADDLSKRPDFLKQMYLGRVLGKPFLNIYDTGDIMTSRGGMKYDDEGVECRRAELVKGGKLVGRLNSRWSAAELGEPVTGSARALSYVFPPIVRMRNTCIGPGESTFEDLIKDVKLGLYAVGSGGGQTNGEMFNFAAFYGVMIRDGKLAELVRDVKLSGNVFTTLENIDMVAGDQSPRNGAGGCGKGPQSPLPTSGDCPHIRIRNVVVGGVK